jgi:hypothetical protein
MSNPYFKAQKGVATEQALYERMIIESIEIAGLDVFYIPRKISDRMDQIFGEDVLSSFESYAEVCVYINDITAWGGEGQMLSKFGLEQRDTATIVIARKKYTDLVVPIVPSDRHEKLKWRPNEGDLIYLPFSHSLMEIKFVEDEDPSFYQLNKKFVWTMRCELMQLNNDKFDTGIPEVDDKFNLNFDRLAFNIMTEDGFSLLKEDGGVIVSEEYTVAEPYVEIANYGDNEEIKKEFLDIMNFNSDNPFNERF